MVALVILIPQKRRQMGLGSLNDSTPSLSLPLHGDSMLVLHLARCQGIVTFRTGLQHVIDRLVVM